MMKITWCDNEEGKNRRQGDWFQWVTVYKESVLPKNLKEVCETLATKYGHKDLWFDWRPWASSPGRPNLQNQPVVISCSRRILAEYDGKMWHYLNSPDYIRFNPIEDAYDPSVDNAQFLDELCIKKWSLFLFL